MRSGSRAGIMRAIVVLAALFAGGAEAALYKCKQPDGTIRFSDAPCPATPGARKDPVVGEPVSAPDPEAAVAADPQTAPAAPQPTPEPAAAAAASAEPAPAAPPPASPADEAAAPERELRTEPAVKRSLDLLMWLGAAIAFVGTAQMIYDAHKKGRTLLSWALFFINPLCWIYPLLDRDKKVLIAGALYAVGAITCAVTYTPGVDLMWAPDGAVARDEDSWPTQGRTRFSLEDRVKVMTVVHWPDRWWDRNHYLQVVWYTNGELAYTNEVVHEFKKNPLVLRGSTSASKLGPGSHRVELYIDGELFHAESFKVADI